MGRKQYNVMGMGKRAISSKAAAPPRAFCGHRYPFTGWIFYLRQEARAFLTHPLARRQRILTQESYISLSFKLIPSEMSLTTFTRYCPLDHTLEGLSNLGAGVLVLVTSLVSFHAHVYI